MSKQIIKRYSFNPVSRTVTFTDFDENVRIERLALITNMTTNTVIFNFADPTRGGIASENSVILDYDTSQMNSADILRIDYDTSYGDISYDKTTVGNSRSKFRDGFATAGSVQPNPDVWDLVEDTPGAHIMTQGGNAAGSSYLRISLSPFVEADGIQISSKAVFQYPMRVGFGISASQRIVGQEFFAGMIACDENGDIEYGTPVPDKAITGTTISVTSNIGTVTMTNHGFNGGDRVVVYGCADHRMNVGPVVVTIVDANTFTIPVTIANASYSSVGGFVRTSDPLRYAKNGAGFLFENATATNASFVSRRNGAKFRSAAQTIASTTATQGNNNPYTDSFNSSGNQELYFTMDEVSYRSYASDSTGGMSGATKYTQNVPDEELDYKIVVRARNLNGFSLPVGRVVSASKTGTTTATVTTDVPHGLATGDFVQIYGARDQTNFAQLSTQTAIASVPSSTTFTIVWGSAVTASTVNGVVWANHGQLAAPGVFGQAIQSISRTGNVLTVNGSAAWSGPVAGEYVQLHGLDPAASAYEGAYKVLRVSTTLLELESVGANFSSITTGGAAIRRTDIRLHFSRVMDYTRLTAEIVGGKGNTSDVNNSVPVSITGAPTLAVSQSTGSSTNIWNSGGYGGILVNDIPSAAITSTATSSTVTPGVIANIGTYSSTFGIVVTAVSGTNPTLDLAIEESPDNGTNWIRVYEFPRITATGSYVSPKLRSTYGTRFRYVRTVGGTTPSFTNAVNRIMWSTPGELTRQFFDRTIALTTQFATTPVYNVDGCNMFQLTLNLGAATTPPQIQIQGSEDGTNWYTMNGANLVGVASSTVIQISKDYLPKFVRGIVSTAGATVTTGYVSIKAVGA